MLIAVHNLLGMCTQDRENTSHPPLHEAARSALGHVKEMKMIPVKYTTSFFFYCGRIELVMTLVTTSWRNDVKCVGNWAWILRTDAGTLSLSVAHKKYT